MSYFIDPDGNYPRHIGDVKRDNPDWNPETDELPDGWSEVAAGVIPDIPEGFYLNELAPAFVDGVLTRQFEVLPAE